MKVFIIVATTADGFIGQHAQHLATEWTSAEDKKMFMRMTKEAGTMVMGSTTYATIGRPLPGRRTIVYNEAPIDGVETTSEAPTDLVNRLEAEGVKTLAICGGSSIYTQFMRAGLVDELYIDVEPIFFGEGIKLFNTPVEAKLRLISIEKLNDQGTTLHHYAVEK